MSLYVHQNYTQFCDEIEHAEELLDSLSISDVFLSGVGETVSLCEPIENVWSGAHVVDAKVDASRDILPVRV